LRRRQRQQQVQQQQQQREEGEEEDEEPVAAAAPDTKQSVAVWGKRATSLVKVSPGLRELHHALLTGGSDLNLITLTAAAATLAQLVGAAPHMGGQGQASIGDAAVGQQVEDHLSSSSGRGVSIGSTGGISLEDGPRSSRMRGNDLDEAEQEQEYDRYWDHLTLTPPSSSRSSSCSSGSSSRASGNSKAQHSPWQAKQQQEQQPEEGQPLTPHQQRLLAFKTLDQLLALVQPHLLELDPQATATLLFCMARIRSSKPEHLDFAGDLLHVSTEQLSAGSFKSRELSSLAWALPRLQVLPSRRWWAGFYTSCEREWAGFTPQGFACLGWCLGRTQRQPDKDWLGSYADAAARCLGGYTGQGLVLVAWGLARRGATPPAAWVGSWVRQLVHQQASLAPQGLALVWW
jgi:hypothetical protein